jgi:hypothetical protein
MHIVRDSDGDPQAFRDMARDMSAHDHPLVRCAAGWAAIEAATIPNGHAISDDWTLEKRQEAIAFAGSTWQQIDENAWEHHTSGLPGNIPGQAWAASQRNRWALAYLPAFALMAEHLGGEAVSPHETQAGVMAVKQQLLPVIQRLMGALKTSPDNGGPPRPFAVGAVSELVTAWFLQPEFREGRMSPGRLALSPCLVVPASMRDQHNYERTSRINLLAVPLRADISRKRIRVVGQGAEKNYDPHALQINVASELYSKEVPPRRVLHAIQRCTIDDNWSLPRGLREVAERLNDDLARSMLEKA